MNDQREEEELTFKRHPKWKVNPVVHKDRGVLGYAKGAVMTSGRQEKWEHGEAPVPVPIVRASKSNKHLVHGEGEGAVKLLSASPAMPRSTRKSR